MVNNGGEARGKVGRMSGRILAQLRRMAADKALEIGEAWNALEAAADRIEALEAEMQAVAFDQARAQAQKMGDEGLGIGTLTAPAAGAAAGTEPAEEEKPWPERITFRRGAPGQVVLRTPVKDGNGWIATNVALTMEQALRLSGELTEAMNQAFPAR
jgi:hypothetical protein